jgi:hypothetical protein
VGLAQTTNLAGQLTCVQIDDLHHRSVCDEEPAGNWVYGQVVPVTHAAYDSDLLDEEWFCRTVLWRQESAAPEERLLPTGRRQKGSCPSRAAPDD